jgi:hypothetical protein
MQTFRIQINVKIYLKKRSSKAAVDAAAANAAGEGQQQKSKADLRRERAAIQEAQRAKKAAEQAAKKPAGAAAAPAQKPQNATQSKIELSKTLTSTQTTQNEKETTTQTTSSTTSLKITSNNNQNNLVFETAPVTLKLNKKNSTENLNSAVGAAASYKLKLFHHFDQYKRDYSITEKLSLDNPQIHPAFIKLGLQLAHDVVSGSNARCTGFLNAFRKFLHDFKHNENKTLSKDLETKLKHNIK